jgi:hypothetical protein
MLSASNQTRTDDIHLKSSSQLLCFQEKFLSVSAECDFMLNNDQSTVQLPNFIEREAELCAKLSSKLESNSSNSNVSTLSRFSDVSPGLIFQPMSQILSSSRSLAHKTDYAKAPIMIPISEVDHNQCLL